MPPDIASYNIYTIRQSILGHFDLNPLKPKVRFDASRALLMPFRPSQDLQNLARQFCARQRRYRLSLHECPS